MDMTSKEVLWRAQVLNGIKANGLQYEAATALFCTNDEKLRMLYAQNAEVGTAVQVALGKCVEARAHASKVAEEQNQS